MLGNWTIITYLQSKTPSFSDSKKFDEGNKLSVASCTRRKNSKLEQCLTLSKHIKHRQNLKYDTIIPRWPTSIQSWTILWAVSDFNDESNSPIPTTDVSSFSSGSECSSLSPTNASFRTIMSSSGATYIIREDAMFDADLVAFVAGYQPEFPTLRFNISSTNKQPNINRMLCIHKRQCLSVECTTRFLIGRNTSEWQGFFGLPTELTHTDFYSNRKTMNVA